MTDLADSPIIQKLGKVAAECGEATGAKVISLPDLRAWELQGRPKVPTEHRWESKGDVIVCVWCGVEDDPEERHVYWCPDPQAN